MRNFLVGVVITLLIPLWIFVPWTIGERIGFGTTLLLTLVVMLLIVSEHLPKTDKYPTILQYYTVLLLWACLFVIGIIFLTTYQSEKYTQTTEQRKQGRQDWFEDILKKQEL